VKETINKGGVGLNRDKKLEEGIQAVNNRGQKGWLKSEGVRNGFPRTEGGIHPL